MLVGRERERELLEVVVADAVAGRGRAVVLLGEPGIGKTEILEALCTESTAARLLRTRGRETEAALPFAALADVLEPLLGGLDELPEAQQAALRSALALGAQRSTERFALCAATLALFAWGSEAQPLLVVLDDAHWLDTSSLEALLFAAARLRSERIAFVLASRHDNPRFGDLERIVLTGLDEADALALLEPAGVGDDVARELASATAGNPLALLELPQLLTEGQRTGAEPLQDPIPLAPALEQAFLRRAEGLPAPTRRALLLAAAEGDGPVEVLVSALAAESLGLDALAGAERKRLVSLVAGEVRFRHPLVRAALYGAADAPERRRAHAVLAEHAPTAWRRAWHLAAATPGPSEAVAFELEQAALEARSRSAYAAAARTLERAAQLSPGPGDQARRLLMAASDQRLAGREPRAVELLDRVLALRPDPLLAADAEHLRARIRLGRAPDHADRVRLLAAARSVETLDSARATLMYLDAALTAVELEEAELADAAVARMKSMLARTRPEIAPELDVLLSGWLDELAPDGVVAYAPRWQGLYPLVDDLANADRLILVASGASYIGEEPVETRELLIRIATAARRASAGWVLAQALAELALLDYRLSDWRTATVEAAESFRLAQETDRPLDVVRALSCLVRIEAGQGREAECREHAAEAWRVADEIGASSMPDWHCNVGLGLLELGLGDPERAARHLELPAGDIDRGGLAPGIFRAAGDLVEAYMRWGAVGKAERVLDEFERRARDVDRTWALAVAARCRGLLSDDDFEHHFERSLELHDRMPVPFERGRTHLCYGERLRRARRRVDARRQLESARDELDRVGAALWARRAEQELAASGERLRPRDGAAADELTPQELQLARLVATGATNKEVAAALFVSPKTVEAHLGAIYRKLGLRSRTELAATLGAGA